MDVHKTLYPFYSNSSVQNLVMPGATAWLYAPYQIQVLSMNTRMVVMVTGYTLFVTSQYDVIFTFANQCFGEVCWHNIHIILHALSLLLQCVTVSALHIRRPEQNTALNAVIELFNCKNIQPCIKTGEYNTLSATSAQFTIAKI